MASVADFGKTSVTAAEAVHCVKSGDRILIHSGAAEPEPLVQALTARAKDLKNVEVAHLLTLGEAGYVKPEYAGSFYHRAWFVGPNVRKAIEEGRGSFTPIFLSEIPKLLRSGKMPIDVALIQTSPPDAHGWMSYGVSVDITKAGTEAAKHVVAMVNPKMPRAHGDSYIHVNDVDTFVELEADVIKLPPRPPSEEQTAIGKHIAGLIKDGATLQMGIGGIPDAVLANLSQHNDLGIHTEMFSDGVVPLAKAGNINGQKKTLNRGKIISSFCFGGQDLYDFIDDNPQVEMRPSQYVNDPFVIAQHDNMVSINSALMIDLTGQVCADSMGYSIFSGIGGQVDFTRGASRSKNGLPIIAMPSTAKGGTISRIVPALSEGSGVVTSRGDVHFVVTEYGVAELWGNSVVERAEALINIAHPSFRDELRATLKAHKWVGQS